MKNIALALLGGLLISLFIVALTLIGMSIPYPEDQIVGYPPGHRQ